MTREFSMSDHKGHGEGQEQAIAGLLRYGVWLASAVIGAGLATEWLRTSATTTLMA